MLVEDGTGTAHSLGFMDGDGSGLGGSSWGDGYGFGHGWGDGIGDGHGYGDGAGAGNRWHVRVGG